MTMKKTIATIILLIAFIGVSHAQEGTLFDYQIQKQDSVNYEMQFQLFNTANVQFIEVKFLEKGNELAMNVASLNQKKDGKFYLSCDGDEKMVSPGEMTMNFTHDFGMLQEHSVMVRLLDKDFNLIDSYQKVIEY